MGLRGEPFGAELPFKSIMSDDLLKRSKFWMPVHAVGYNWLASNAVAAEKRQFAKVGCAALYRWEGLGRLPSTMARHRPENRTTIGSPSDGCLPVVCTGESFYSSLTVAL
jgi:hypothetical protein